MTKRKIIWFTSFLILAGTMIYYFYPESKLPSDAEIDSIIVYKSERKMLVYSDGELLKTYRISLGRQPIGAKEFEGDRKTPEGIYFIDSKNPHSSYHRNLGISYPNENDIAHAEQHEKSAGGLIKIHGLRNRFGFIGKFHRWVDWTLGCIAVTNQEMRELYRAVKIGAIIEIKP